MVDTDSDWNTSMEGPNRTGPVYPELSVRGRAIMESMGIESPELHSSQNSTMTFRELASLTSEISSPKLNENTIDEVSNERWGIPLNNFTPDHGVQCGMLEKAPKRETVKKLSREEVAKAMKVYLFKRKIYNKVINIESHEDVRANNKREEQKEVDQLCDEALDLTLSASPSSQSYRKERRTTDSPVVPQEQRTPVRYSFVKKVFSSSPSPIYGCFPTVAELRSPEKDELQDGESTRFRRFVNVLGNLKFSPRLSPATKLDTMEELQRDLEENEMGFFLRQRDESFIENKHDEYDEKYKLTSFRERDNEVTPEKPSKTSGFGKGLVKLANAMKNKTKWSV